MCKQKKLLFYLLLCLIVHGSFGTVSKSEKVVISTAHVFEKKLLDLINKTKALLPVSSDALIQQKKLAEARLAFKQIEFWILYVDSKENKGINGPNIISNETDSTSSNPIIPHGFQVMEDLVYAENYNDSIRTEIEKECIRINHIFNKILQRQKNNIWLSDKEFHAAIWDFFRLGIYRVESLGITGFDVPKSLNSIAETEATLTGIFDFVKVYAPILPKGKNGFSKGNLLFKNAINFLQQERDFNKFDRLVFMKEHLHPISEWLTDITVEMDWKIPVNAIGISKSSKHLFAEPVYNENYFMSGNNPDRIKLGKKLFYDPILSGDGTRTCATCHMPEKAFADGKKKSLSFSGSELQRNTPTLLNATLQTRLFYDSRVKTLEKQAIHVIHNTDEMGGNLSGIVEKIKHDPEYITLFNHAFTSGISEFTIVNALSAYIKTLVSLNSRFDRYMRGENIELTDSEKRGFNLFAGKAKCATCHFMPFFNGLVPPFYNHTESEILGVPADAKHPTQLDKDLGRYGYTRLQLHKHAFKTSGIRNAELTAPYMHNGVFATLQELMDFYNNGGGAGQGMELPSQTLPADSLHLSQTEMDDIIHFIQSLTDTSGNY